MGRHSLYPDAHAAAPPKLHPRGPVKARALGGVAIRRGETREGIKRHPNHPNRLPDRSKKAA